MLRFSPTAWAKLLFLRDAGPTEIGGFGISGAGDVLLVEDVRLVWQTCDWVSVAFDDQAVADFFDDHVDADRRPEQFGRIWVHTHPGHSPRPSLTDEETFARVFGGCDWSVMLIVARGGATYARLQFGVGPGGAIEIAVEVDYGAEFLASDWDAWQAEYAACIVDSSVLAATGRPVTAGGLSEPGAADDAWPERDDWLQDARLWEFPYDIEEEQSLDDNW